MQTAKTLSSTVNGQCNVHNGIGDPFDVMTSLSNWADAQADLSLRWAQRSCCWFCHKAAHIITKCSHFYVLITVLYMTIWYQIRHCSSLGRTLVYES